MSKPSSNRLRAAALACVAACLVALAGSLSTAHEERSSRAAQRTEAVTVARILADRLQRPVLDDSPERASAVLRDGVHMSSMESARVIGADGRMLAQWSRQVTVARDQAGSPGETDSSGRTVLVTHPIHAAHRPIGSVTLRVRLEGATEAGVGGLTIAALSLLAAFVAAVAGFLGGGTGRRDAVDARADEAPAPGPGEDEPADGAAIAELRDELAARNQDLAEAMRSLDEQSEAKSQFLANMSHEIRTPLNGVLGMTELLINTGLDEKQQQFTRTLRRSAEALLNIVNDILDFSRMEAGKLHLESHDFDLVELVEDVAHLHAESAQVKGLELACHIPPGMPAQVRGDSGRLRQVLTNLLSNSIKFTETGEVLVQVKVLEEHDEAVLYAIEVADTGIGIPHALQERIFSSFVQVDGSMTRRYGGSGLGLSISKQLVDLMGGEISVDSDPGQGACFVVKLTLPRTVGRPQWSPDPARPSIHGLRMLIVDDNETNRIILNQQLTSWQVEVDQRADAPSALDTLREAAAAGRPFDIGILDMQMPDMDGLQLAQAIKAEAGIADIRLMLLTSAALDLESRELHELGIDQYTTKPARQSQLYNCLVSLVGEQPEKPDAGRPGPAGGQAPVEAPIGGAVLLVEDNAVNQEVARNMLEDLGCAVQVVENGRLALAACEAGAFDVILMDCQMPVMDGFEATVALKERGCNGGPEFSTPIVALTANALAGDRERCLAAGMDDYISKPFKQSELRAVLERWTGKRSEARIPSVPPSPPDEPPAGDGGVQIDASSLENLRQLQRPGRPDVLGKVLRLYVDRTPAAIETIARAGREQDFAGLQTAAHGLKSSSANVGAVDMTTLCRELEECGRACTSEGVSERIGQLEPIFRATTLELERLYPAAFGEAPDAGVAVEARQSA